MKYIDADKLIAEIVRLKETNPSEYNYQNAEGYVWALDDILDIINSLLQEQPSLPSNLDEAAREIVIKMHPCLKDCTILGDRLTRGQLMALVKAGAEWMAGQGIKSGGIV